MSKIKKMGKTNRINRMAGISIPVCLILFVFMFSSAFAVGEVSSGIGGTASNDKVQVYFFWGDGCPHCAEEKPFLAEMESEYDIEVHYLEVWYNEDNAALFEEMSAAYGKDVQGVPTTFIGDNVWIGYSKAISWDIEDKIQDCVDDDNCVNPLEKVYGEGSNGDVLHSGDTVSPANPICVHVFIDPTCEPCRNIGPYLDSLSDTYNINMTRHDVTQDSEMELFSEFKEMYGIIDVGFPILFIGDTYLVGQDMINSHLEDEIDLCLDDGCLCPDEYIKGTIPYPPKQGDFVPSSEDVIDLPLVGEVHLSAMPLLLSTGLIALVDGFNPCSLWVLTFLLGIVVYSGSRKKVFIVGATFLVVTAAAYGLFMLGVINVLKYTMYIPTIRVLVALVALVFGLVNVKDFFWFKKGLSFTISDKYKPKIFKDVRGIMKADDSIMSMVFGTAVMALGITLVELPCTAGFPVIWSNLIAQHEVGGVYFALLFGIYMLIYLIDEIFVFSTAVLTLQASHFEEKHGRILKLIGGMIMVALALVLIFSPETMNDVGGTFAVFGGALVLSLLIVFVYSKKVGFKAIDSDNENHSNHSEKPAGAVGGPKDKKKGEKK